MANKCAAHVLLKADPVQQKLVDISTSSLSPLAPSSVRIQTFLIGLTANNLSYASSGTLLHWWDAYPVPKFAPPPYNDTEIYGIVIAWGYATVVESTISSIPIGHIIWGAIPISTFPTDLMLTPTSMEDHWTEISPHRKLVMPFYQRYVVSAPQSETAEVTKDATLNGARGVSRTLTFINPSPYFSRMALTSILAIWESAYLLNRYIFPYEQVASPAIHPLGTGLPWTASDGNLRTAVIVSLGAGSKTSKAFTHQLLRNRPYNAHPLGLLEVTSDSSISTCEPFHESPFPRKTASYADLTTSSTLTWLTARNSARIIILDFGGRDNAVEKLHSALLEPSSSPSRHLPQVAIINIGKEARIYSASDLAAGAVQTRELGKVQMNTSGVREAAIEQVGEQRYFREKDEAWERFFRDPHGAEKVVKVVLGEGMKGDNGVEGGWRKLCAGQANANEGLAFLL